MSRGVLLRLLIVIGLLAGCVALSVTKEPRLGLDLRGGTQIMLETSSTPRVEANAENTDKAIEVLRGRIDSLGVAEPEMTRVGENRIQVDLPDVQDPRRAEEALGRTAQLTIHPVVKAVAGKNAKPAKGNEIYRSEDGQWLEVGASRISGDEITNSEAAQPQNSLEYVVNIDFNGPGGDTWKDMTAKAACFQDDRRRVAIVLDNKIISSPPMAQSIECNTGITGGSTQISGQFSQQAAKDLAVLIEGGALPLPVKIIQKSQVGPTLGDEAIAASFQAGIIGLILTGLFVCLVYRFVGLMATLALSTYALLSYAMLVGLGSTLTLPGLAGFVLAIGMAIDANVLVFERAREEYERNPAAGLKRALMIGFNKAWSAIMDSNVTTLLAAALLFLLASGPVKGFGVTLSIGVIASMISALVIARVLSEIGVQIPWVKKHPKVSGVGDTGPVRRYLDEHTPNLMRRKTLWLGISAAALVASVAGIFGGMNLGVEFTGGRTMEYSTAQSVTVEEARTAISDAGFPDATVTTVDNDKISVSTGQISDQEKAEIQGAIGEVGGQTTVERDDVVAASLGAELRDKALLAFGIALLAQMIYLAFRFKWTFGVAAVVAMLHDVLIVVGLFAWLDKPIDGVFLAAAMTIIGLSVNDTVVVFDRIRERWRASRSESFQSLANLACVETMPRTVNTGLGTMFILAALAILGGDTLQDFAIALLVGLIIGTYSSVFMATPLLILLQKISPMARSEKVRSRRRDPQDSGAVL